MKRKCLLVVAALGWLAVTGGGVPAASLLAPGDFILGIDLEGDGSQGSWPGGEPPAAAIDGMTGPEPNNTKYLNFGDENSGLIVTPLSGSSTVQSLVFWTANDTEGRDPASYELYGTNSPIVSQDDYIGLSEPWTLISSGALALPSGRDTQAAAVDFANGTAYTSYKLLFPTIKDSGTSIMQINEIQLYTGAGGAGTAVFAPGDPVVGIDRNLSPPAESVANAIDGDPGTKYLNFAKENSGFIVTPGGGPDAVRSFRLTTANDADSRDPTSWILYGTNDPILSEDDSLGDGGETWTEIDSGSVDLPLARNELGPFVIVDNDTAYASYRIIFPTMRDAAAGNADSMQYSEIQFYNVAIPEPSTIALAALALLGLCGTCYRRKG